MSNAQHTPGPWKAHPTGLSRSGVPEHEIHWSEAGECVAEIVHGTADAHLIAAAPELLEVIEALVNEAHELRYNERKAWARLVIAKAKGIDHV